MGKKEKVQFLTMKNNSTLFTGLYAEFISFCQLKKRIWEKDNILDCILHEHSNSAWQN